VSILNILVALALLGWFLSPAVLGIVALFRLRRDGPPKSSLKAALLFGLGVGLLADWLLFAFVFVKSQDSYGAYFETSALTGLLLLFAIMAVLASAAARRWLLTAAACLLATLWVGIVYAQAHWLVREDFGSAKIQQRPVQATIYFGNPRDSEAEAMALVRVPGIGDYYFDFLSEKYRSASRNEFIPFHYGVWTIRPMTYGDFRQPLKPQDINELRIQLNDGRVLIVTF
jgi:hypothetical protein